MAKIPRILIVEDDDIIANIISQMLKKKGYTIVGTVASGEAAIRKAVELEPDLILMDINLSGLMDGITAARYIFQIFGNPIVFLTGLCDDSLVERAKSSQPYGYLIKPFTDRELTTNVGLALYNHSIKNKLYPDNHPVGNSRQIWEAFDSIILTDTKGMIIFFNPYAGRFLEIPDNQILMPHWRDVVMFINDQTDTQLIDPIPEVVQQKVAVMFEFNTAVVTRSGKRHTASITVRPIMDDKKDILGVFMYIKEKPNRI
jgi:CheY-like chemotaxis protein